MQEVKIFLVINSDVASSVCWASEGEREKGGGGGGGGGARSVAGHKYPGPAGN
jgi:hypothetical protein